MHAEGSDCVLTEAAARARSEQTGETYVSPYNDPVVVAGQGTLAVELTEQLDGVDAVFASLGGGGLVSGIGTWLRHHRPSARLYACSPANSAVMHHALDADRILDLSSEPTLSDGTAGGVESGSITYDLCGQVVDERILVTEDEIAAALREVIGRQHQLVEGAAGVAVAGARKRAAELKGARVAVVLCGANIGLDKLRAVLQA